MSRSETVTRVVRGTLLLSVGSASTRAAAALGQAALAIWLSPTDLGYWAAASALLSVLTGVINFGEVNGYLSRPDASLREARRRSLRLNLMLAGTSLAMAAVVWANGRDEVALLMALIAVSIPVTGEADVRYAAYLKTHRNRGVVLAQGTAAAVKIVTGVVLAWLTGSALAIAVSSLLFPLAMLLCLRRLPPEPELGPEEARDPVQRRARWTWAVNSWSQTLATQSGFIVAQAVAPPALVGVYYLAYQVTAGLSGLVAAPLARSTLSALGAAPPHERAAVSTSLLGHFGASVGVLAALVALFEPLAAHVVTGEWSAALPVVVVLLAGLPARMLAPVLEPLQQASGRWWTSTAANTLDAVGTAAAGFVALTGDVLLLAAATTAWKCVISLVRIFVAMRGTPLRPRLPAIVVPGLYAVLLGCSVMLPTAGQVALTVAALLLAAGWVALTVRPGRPAVPGRPG